jgi:hypothetical protein
VAPRARGDPPPNLSEAEELAAMNASDESVALSLLGTVVGAVLLGVGIMLQGHLLVIIGLVLIPVSILLTIMGFPGARARDASQ